MQKLLGSIIIKIKNHYSLLAIALIFLSQACLPDFEKRTVVSNPTTYVFDYSKNEVKRAIIDVFSRGKSNDMVLSYRSSKLKPRDTLDIFDQPGNYDDFYLHPSRFIIGESSSYFINGRKADYHVDGFHLHVSDIDGAHTQVEIITIDPKIIAGKHLLPSGPHFTRELKFIDVPPSTIEEYEILLLIGKSLGQKGMPELKKPVQ